MISEAKDQGTIGFIGLGSIGFPMMARLARTRKVFVQDIDPAALDRASKLGAVPCTTAKQVADQADIVCACLPTPKAAQAVLNGSEGVAAGKRIRLYVDHSTIGSNAVQANAAHLQERGVAMLDAPIAGGVLGAEAGELSIIISGAKQSFEQSEPILRRYASKLIHVSERIGDAQVIKLANNMIVSANLIVAAEAILFAIRSGIAAENALDTLNECTARSFATERLLSRFVINREFSSGFRLELMQKDLQLCLDQAEHAKNPMSVCTAAKQFFDDSVANGIGSHDVTEVVCQLENISGAQIAHSRTLHRPPLAE